jgi:uncharacterized metal-binding protein YceD (DUF177 family)
MEFCRRIELDRLGASETTVDIAASAAERVALARRFALLALDRLEAQVTLVRLPGGLLRLSAALSADVVQECVATLEPVPSRVDERFMLLYGAAQDETGEVMLSGEAELVEPLTGAALDIGEAVAQQLSLALDPFPRAPGPAAAAAETGPSEAQSFAALAKWQERG